MTQFNLQENAAGRAKHAQSSGSAVGVPTTNGAQADPTTQALTLYPSKSGTEGEYWTKEYGVVHVPEGWEFLPRGDAFLTRRLKQGQHWVLRGQYSRRGGYAPVKGVFVPASAIAEAKKAAEATQAQREKSREKSQKDRTKKEEEYHQQFYEACLRFLDFAAEHSELAKEIACGATAQACEKHSGRVGRTRQIGLNSRAALAVRAYIRHNHTDYHERLPQPFDLLRKTQYRQAKDEANEEVDYFLEQHRKRS